MKKILFYIVIILMILGVSGSIIYNVMYNNDSKSTLSVEQLIKNDKLVMDTVSKDYTFFESRVVLDTAFNETDEFNPIEVTNVFQFLEKDENNEDQPNVYMFIHDINGNTLVEKHPGGFMLDDIAIDLDSIKINFAQAFINLKQSNYPPSKSKYITLRHGFGRYSCNPFYSLGNEALGHLWVDAITGEVTDKDPATVEK